MSEQLDVDRLVAERLRRLFGPMSTVDIDPFELCDDEPFQAIPVELDPPDPDMRVAAERHLAALVEALARAQDDAARARGIARIEGALALLFHTGCIAVEQIGHWRERVAAVVPPPAPEPGGDAEGGGGPRVVKAAGVLRAVVPVPLARHDGLCMLSVSISEHTTEVAWHLVHRGRMRFVDAHAIAESVTLADDVGTDYGELAGGAQWGRSGTAPYAVRGWSHSESPVPAHATRLTIARDDARWDVPLPGL